MTFEKKYNFLHFFMSINALFDHKYKATVEVSEGQSIYDSLMVKQI